MFDQRRGWAQTTGPRESGIVGAVRHGGGLGTGSTVIFAIRRIGTRLRAGDLSGIRAVATSRATEAAARALGVPMLTDDIPREIDFTFDGADKVDTSLDLIKGGGGALLREKIVAQASRREVIVVDESKLFPRLCTHWPLPVEVIEFGWRSQARFLESYRASVTPRTGEGGLYRPAQGNIILDSRSGPITDPAALANLLMRVPASPDTDCSSPSLTN